MSKNFAVVENGKVINVIVADDNFAQMYSASPDHVGECFEYDETNSDDTKVARIGELYINGLFVSEDQAIGLGLIPAPAPIVPDTVTRAQAKLALLQAGLLATVESAIANGTDEALKIEWADRLEFKRDWPSLNALAASLSITSAQLDDLFILASTL